MAQHTAVITFLSVTSSRLFVMLDIIFCKTYRYWCFLMVKYGNILFISVIIRFFLAGLKKLRNYPIPSWFISRTPIIS